MHENSSAQTCKEKYKALAEKKQKTWHMHRRFPDVRHVIQQESAAFDALTVLLSVVPSPALHWTQPLLRQHTNCSQVALGLGCFTWTPYIFKCLKLILTSSFRLDY